MFVAGQQTVVDSVQMDALSVNDRIRTTLNADGGQIVGCSEIATSQRGLPARSSPTNTTLMRPAFLLSGTTLWESRGIDSSSRTPRLD